MNNQDQKQLQQQNQQPAQASNKAWTLESSKKVSQAMLDIRAKRQAKIDAVFPENEVIHSSYGDSIYSFKNSHGLFCYVHFRGRSLKIWDQKAYKNIDDRDIKINELLYFIDEIETEKNHNRQILQSKIMVGSILYTVWGCDQTNADFYEVVNKIGNRSFELRKIRSEVVQTIGSVDKTKPIAGQFLNDDLLTRRIGEYGIKIDYSRARIWQGESVSVTNPNYYR